MANHIKNVLTRSQILILGDFNVVKLEWGVKRTCQNCASRFYDLQRSPIVCPKCASVYEIQTGTKRGRGKSIADPVKAAAFIEEDILDQELDLDGVVDESLDDDLIEDTSDLGEDLDEMSDVVEVDKDEDEM